MILDAVIVGAVVFVGLAALGALAIGRMERLAAEVEEAVERDEGRIADEQEGRVP